MRPVPVRFGGVLGDVGDLLSNVPGADWLADATSPFSDAIGKFAKTKVGFHVLSTISSGAAYGALLPLVGPPVALVTMAAPGLVAGEDFTTAFTKGLLDSLAKLAFVLTLPIGGSGALIVLPGASAGAASLNVALENYKDDVVKTINRPEIQEALDSAAIEAKKNGITLKDALARLGITLDGLARRLNVRQDVAAHAVNARAHEIVFDTTRFDSRTGVEYPPSGALPPPFDLSAVPSNLSVAEYDDLHARARADGRTPQAVLDALNSLRAVAKARELAGSDPYKQWKLTREAARASPGDRMIADVAAALAASYQAIATQPRKVRDARRALAEATEERARMGRRQPPVSPESLKVFDARVAELQGELVAIEGRLPGGFRVAPLTLGGELRKVGTFALLTSPLWGYVIFRNRNAVLSMLRGLVP